uniref:Uncharacterized protein n=1 Tax=Kalanchoe fedtschenkoi TaxID=63787 RepID=A0A7N0T7S5_KALFE
MDIATPCGSRKKSSFGKRCLLIAKQHRTRLHILGRCISMLLCWHNHSLVDDY